MLAFFLLPAITAVVAFFAFSAPVSAAQTIPYKMNFQGKLADASGVPLANGTYNMKFRIYDATTSGTLQWSEQRAVSAGTGVTITTGGLFSVQLGDVSSLPVGIFTNQNLYFEVELPTPATATCSTASCEAYTEGAMTPRNKLGSSAYAFNSDTLDGVDGSQFARNDTTNTFSALQTLTGGATVQATSTSALSVQKAAGSDVLLTADTTNNVIKIGNSTAVSGSDTTVIVLDSATSATVPTGGPGAMYFDSTNNKFMCYTTSWVSCSGGGMTKTVTLAPEYPGGILHASGSNNSGTMTSDMANGLTSGQGYKHNFYQWTTGNATAQSYDVVVNTGIPTEYAGSFGGLKIWTYSSNTTNATGTIQLQDNTGATCYASPVAITPSATTTWQQITVGAISGCTINASGIVTITIHMVAASNAIFEVGEISYTYMN